MIGLWGSTWYFDSLVGGRKEEEVGYIRPVL